MLYRGYLLANLIALLHINIYATVRDLWSRSKVDLGEHGDILASKEMVGMLASLMLLHPLDTIKYYPTHSGKTSSSTTWTNPTRAPGITTSAKFSEHFPSTTDCLDCTRE